ncbi:MAG: SpoIIE family protein phosphatase [Holophagaceae bacterium]|nr:SpoIIE family protein phosphatase [Holophagaceae bacterium]
MSPSLQRIKFRLIFTSLLGLLLCLGSFALFQWVYSYSDDQCSWVVEGNRVVIREILPNGVAEEAGMLEGDVLKAISGRKVTPQTLNDAQNRINEEGEGRILVYTLEREGRTLQQPVRLVKPFSIAGLLVVVSALVAWGLGLLVVVSSAQRKVARHFFYMGVLALLVPLVVRPFLGTLPPWLNGVRVLFGSLAVGLLPPMWFHFFLRFPHPFPLRKNRRFLQGLYLVFGLVGFFNLLLGLLQAFREYFKTHVDPRQFEAVGGFITALFGPKFQLLVTSLIFAAAIAGAICFWRGAWHLPASRRRALLPALILTSAVMLDFVALVVLGFVFKNSLLFRREAWVFFTPLPLLPLAFAYAIVRHGFLDVRRAILRWLSYFLVLGTVLLCYLGGLAWLFAQGMTAVPPAWIGALLGLSALPVGWLLRRMLKAVRKGFRRDLSTTREIILGQLRETKKRFSEEALLAGLQATLRDAFRPQTMLMLPFGSRSLQLPAAEKDGASYPARTFEIPASLVRHAVENRELVLGLGSDEADWIREQDPSLRAHIDALEAQVLVLILVGEKPHTALLLGGKYSELNYGREDRELLREVAIQAGIVLDTAVLHQRLLDQGRMEQELASARHIQKGMITTTPPETPGFHLALRLDPALETGGDLLWVKHRRSADGKGSWLAAVGDVSGKGLAGALYMSQSIALLEFATEREDQSLEEILPSLDHTLRTLMSQRDFLTLCLLEWDEDGHYRLARAGHPPALLVQGTQPHETTELNPHGRGLGLRPAGPGDWQIQEGLLQPKEWLVLYSDGLTEAMDHKGEQYGLDRFRMQLQRLWGVGSLRAACEAVFQDVAKFETQNRDDRTLLILGRDA